MHAQLEDLYSLKLPLGRNLAGAVWKAETLKGGKPAAVAVLDLEDLSDPELRKRTATRFRRDMGLLRQVNHPHVVRVFDVGRTREGRPFAAMEHVDGESLRDWLEEEHSGADRIRVASALLDGLQAAHRAGVAHGDLEPGNILMTRDGMPKLIGFGLNRTLARQAHPEWNEASGLAKTIAFRAPEETRGLGGHSADLYAAGVLLHVICSGELPSAKGSTLRENASKLPAGMIAVIERALVEDPAERHPNTASMRRSWLAAAKVGRDAVEAATQGFRSEAKPRISALSSPPAVGVALAVEDQEEVEEEEELHDVEMGRPSLMPVGVALADNDDDDDDLTSVPPERINVLSSRPPAVATRKITKRFSDPPADPGMRISLSDVLAEDPEPDPEMRLSLSDVMEESLPTANPASPAKPAMREAPRRPDPAPQAPIQVPVRGEEPSGSKMWIGVLAVLVIGGGGVWFMQQSSDADPVNADPVLVNADPEPTETSQSALEPEPEAPVETEAEPAEVVVVALRLHGLPPGSQVTVDGEPVALDGDSIPFPGDGAEHAITVRAEGYEMWERSLATATPLDLLVVAEALAPQAPPVMEARPLETTRSSVMEPSVMEPSVMEPSRPTVMESQRASMEEVPRATNTTTTDTTTSTMTTMRPGLARDPGF